jgi:hypothetical protein
LAGWRLYVTNAPPERLSLEQSVFYYRQQWQPERGFHLFKRGRLPALAIYFHSGTAYSRVNVSADDRPAGVHSH